MWERATHTCVLAVVWVFGLKSNPQLRAMPQAVDPQNSHPGQPSSSSTTWVWPTILCNTAQLTTSYAHSHLHADATDDTHAEELAQISTQLVSAGFLRQPLPANTLNGGSIEGQKHLIKAIWSMIGSRSVSHFSIISLFLISLYGLKLTSDWSVEGDGNSRGLVG
jgi:hypothetical protein